MTPWPLPCYGEILFSGHLQYDGNTSNARSVSSRGLRVRRRPQSIPGIAEILNMGGGGVKQIEIQPDPLPDAGQWDISSRNWKASRSQKHQLRVDSSPAPREIMVRNLSMTVQLDDIAGHRHQTR